MTQTAFTYTYQYNFVNKHFLDKQFPENCRRLRGTGTTGTKRKIWTCMNAANWPTEKVVPARTGRQYGQHLRHVLARVW